MTFQGYIHPHVPRTWRPLVFCEWQYRARQMDRSQCRTQDSWLLVKILSPGHLQHVNVSKRALANMTYHAYRYTIGANIQQR